MWSFFFLSKVQFECVSLTPKKTTSTCCWLAGVQMDKLESRRSESLHSVRWPAALVVLRGGRVGGRGAAEGSWTQIQVSRHRGGGGRTPDGSRWPERLVWNSLQLPALLPRPPALWKLALKKLWPKDPLLHFFSPFLLFPFLCPRYWRRRNRASSPQNFIKSKQAADRNFQ